MGHSRQMLLPTVERSQADANNYGDTESIAIEIESAGSAEATAPPRS